MFKHQYKEKTYAEEILKNGFTTKHIKHELKILVKYYKFLGHKPKERKELIYKFCEKYLEGYDRVIHYKLINSALNFGTSKKNVLVEINSVGVTSEELKYVDNLEVDHTLRKVVFTLLVLNKLNKLFHNIRNEITNKEHYFGGTKNYKELVTTSKINLKKDKEIHNLIGELDRIGIVEITGNGAIKLSFFYGIPEDENIVLEISSFDNIGFYYDLHRKVNKMKKCNNCDLPMRINGKNQKYCIPCGLEIEKKKTNERVRKYRNNV